MVPGRPTDPLDAVLSPPVGDRLVGEEPVAGVAETDREERHRHHHRRRDRGQQMPAVVSDPPQRPRHHLPKTTVNQHQPEHSTDQRRRDEGVLLGCEGETDPHPEPCPGPRAAMDRTPQGHKGGRRNHRLEDVHAQKTAVVETDRRDRSEQRHPPCGAGAEGPAQRPGNGDQGHAGEGDRQAGREIGLAGDDEGRGGEVVEQRSVVGRIVLVGALFQDHVGGVGVDRLVVVVRATAQIPEMEGQ